MSYIAPVTDRTQADIVSQNSKAYWNVSDWERVYNNARLCNALTAVTLDVVIAFTTITPPTILTIDTYPTIIPMLVNIEALRVAVISYNIPGTLTPIKTDWEMGSRKPAPKFTHVNQWESTIDAIWDYWSGDGFEVCPTLTGDVTILTGSKHIYIDCVNLADYNITIQGTGKLIVL